MSTDQRATGGGTAALVATAFAGVWLMIVGAMQFFQGLVALGKDTDTVLVRTQEYIFAFDVTMWGWIHLILGILLFVVGAVLLTGATWARVIAVVLASLSIIANFLWLPYYPWWSILIIAANAFVIWGLLRYPDAVRDA